MPVWVSPDSFGTDGRWQRSLSSLTLVGLGEAFKEFLPVSPGRGLCPQTPAGEGTPQTPIKRIEPTGGCTRFLQVAASLRSAVLRSAYIINIFFFSTFSTAKIRHFFETAKINTDKFCRRSAVATLRRQSGGVCYQYFFFSTFSTANRWKISPAPKSPTVFLKSLILEY